MADQAGIRWRPWSEASFQEAKRADKPIVLRLSAVWCHWCHVMDQTSDRHPDVIRALNERYVPIRVDIDQMPDVSERYNFGGFPTSAFLTPTGDILTGGTYIPPEEFRRLLEDVGTAWKTRRGEIEEKLREGAAHEATHLERAPPPAAPGGPVAAQILEAVGESLLLNFDPAHGGFGTAPKFPHSAAVELAIRLHLRNGGDEYATLVKLTLDGMRAGDLRDAAEKGFFRYATQADWRVPHFEKMLETNAGLLANYALAGRVLANESWREVVREQRSYVSRVLRDPATGLFRGSQDADEDYYAQPLSGRQARAAPFVDPTSYTDWTSMMILAYLEGYLATADAGFEREAVAALDALLARLRTPEGAFHHFRKPDGRAERTGLFADQVYASFALLRGHELTGSPAYLDAARRALDTARHTHWDPQTRRFLDRVPAAEELGRLAKKRSNPQENGVAVRCLLRLHHFTGDAKYRAQAEELLESYRDEVDRWGLFASEVALGALESQQEPLVVHVVADAAQRQGFFAEASRVPHPYVLVRAPDAARAREMAASLGLSTVEPPAAFACSGKACSRLYKPGERFAADLGRLVAA